jgi:hypothetical protein
VADNPQEKPADGTQLPASDPANGHSQSLNKKVLRADINTNADDIEGIEVRLDGELRNKALIYSMVLSAMLFGAHIWFAYMDRPLLLSPFMEQIIWTIMVAPWIGIGGAKLVTLLADKFKK